MKNLIKKGVIYISNPTSRARELFQLKRTLAILLIFIMIILTNVFVVKFNYQNSFIINISIIAVLILSILEEYFIIGRIRLKPFTSLIKLTIAILLLIKLKNIFSLFIVILVLFNFREFIFSVFRDIEMFFYEKRNKRIADSINTFDDFMSETIKGFNEMSEVKQNALRVMNKDKYEVFKKRYK